MTKAITLFFFLIATLNLYAVDKISLRIKYLQNDEVLSRGRIITMENQAATLEKNQIILIWS